MKRKRMVCLRELLSISTTSDLYFLRDGTSFEVTTTFYTPLPHHGVSPHFDSESQCL
jgi:hypothetical protein